MTLCERTRKTLATQALSEKQYAAAAERQRNVVVTAGAGSGKTRTLVARYLSLLADGLKPDKVVAITFTEKAANEMRSRVRSAIRAQITNHPDQEQQRFWKGLEQQIDAARIGTIHSLCAEILRSHPAQAGIDPLFDVLDEGQATILAADAVEATLVKITMQEKYVPVMEILRVQTLGTMLNQMLRKRLELQLWLQSEKTLQEMLMFGLQPFMQMDEMGQCILELRAFSQQQLESDTNVRGVDQVSTFLPAWQEVENAWQAGDYLQCLTGLVHIRTKILNRLVGKDSSITKTNLTVWRDAYDTSLKWVDKGIDPELEEEINQALQLLKEVYLITLDHYQALLSNQNALDFDDLEYRALQLLKLPEIAQKWQEKVDALLVDEFQDTNQRQRQLVDALTAGKPGGLFVVGDARQSIYRFRGADVSVFREIQREVARADGLVCELDETHRTHCTLMRAMDGILSPLMGTELNEAKPFHVPFTKMSPVRDGSPQHVNEPFLEVLIGAGSDSEEGRLLSANLLAERLVAYKQAGEIKDWKDVALLFRAASGFPVYEQAFESAGIPFVTIAGSGFYDRPEIRDLLNLLRALADPWDDLAMVGFLRSPAVGVSDRGITQLRWPSAMGEAVPLRQAITIDCPELSPRDLQAVGRAQHLLTEFEGLVGKIPVAALLQRLIERSHYRIILAGAADRGWRNIEKLLMDAYASQKTSVHAYLEYVQKIRDSGVREGEAAGGAEDALQLMTIHKSKGLEFSWVVLADASRRPFAGVERWSLVDELVSIHPDRVDYKPFLARYIKELDSEREDAETRRLLYVACTRAMDKLIISGHFSQYKEKFTANGWLKEILNLFDYDPDLLVVSPPAAPIQLAGGERLRLQISSQMAAFAPQVMDIVEEQKIPWSAMLAGDEPEGSQPATAETETNQFILFDRPEKFPLWVGMLLHDAVHHWEYPHPEALQQFLERSALEMGILEVDQRQRAIQQAQQYLWRLQEHPIYKEINQANKRYHEVPFENLNEPQNERGRLDILYQTEDGWKIIDFKTDSLGQLSDLDEERRCAYRAQLLRYQNSVYQQLKEMPAAQFCFLNCGNAIQLVNLEDF